MKIYVKFHQEAEKDDSLNDQAREWFVKMEQGDEEALSIWQWFKDISLVEYKRIYKLLGMDFDHFTGESFYRDKTHEVVEKLQEKDLLVESEGAHIVPLDDYDMAPCLIMKKDGSSIYATRDLAALLYRKRTYNFDKCIYVTGLEQKLHFAQVFKVIELLGYDWYQNLVHVPYGLVSMKVESSPQETEMLFMQSRFYMKPSKRFMKSLMKRILTYQTKKKYPDRLVSEPFFSMTYIIRELKMLSLTGIKFLTLMERQVHMYSTLTQDVPVYSVR